jgi:hypothetical protein
MMLSKAQFAARIGLFRAAARAVQPDMAPHVGKGESIGAEGLRVGLTAILRRAIPTNLKTRLVENNILAHFNRPKVKLNTREQFVASGVRLKSVDLGQFSCVCDLERGISSEKCGQGL